MASRKICDHCGTLPALTHQYFIDREYDGIETANRYGHIDLCHQHAMALLHDLEGVVADIKLKIKLIEQMRKIQERE